MEREWGQVKRASHSLKNWVWSYLYLKEYRGVCVPDIHWSLPGTQGSIDTNEKGKLSDQ